MNITPTRISSFQRQDDLKTLVDFKINVGGLIKELEDYLDTKCNDIVAKGKDKVVP